MTRAIDLSVVIVNYDTAGELERTLQAVLAGAGGIALEVLVVDNASSDGSAAMVRERFPSVALHANAANRYYSAGNNQGLRAARGRHLLVLNPDAEPDAGTLPAMVACMDRAPEIGALSVRLRFPDGTLQRNCSRQPTYGLLLLDYTVLGPLLARRRRRARARHWYEDWDRTTARDVEVLPGSCLMVRREAYERVGGFDERFLMYFAEDDWCGRIREAGFRIVYVPEGRVVHPEGASVRQAARRARTIYFGDLVRFADKRWGAVAAVLLWLLTRPTLWALQLSAAWRRR